jgi:hypothetical protein
MFLMWEKTNRTVLRAIQGFPKVEIDGPYLLVAGHRVTKYLDRVEYCYCKDIAVDLNQEIPVKIDDLKYEVVKNPILDRNLLDEIDTLKTQVATQTTKITALESKVAIK